MTRAPRTARPAIAAAALVLLLAGCGDKAKEPHRDAHRSGSNTSAAQTITMPDGFSNLADKCDHGNRVYSMFHGDSKSSGAVAVVAHDPSCPQPAAAATTPAP